MKIGTSEMIVVVLVALVVIGPDKLPYYAKKLGQALSQLKKYSDDLTKEVKDSIVDPVKEVAEPVKQVTQPIKEAQDSLSNELKDLKKSFSFSGTASTQQKPAAEQPSEGTNNPPVPPQAVEKPADTPEQPAAESRQEI